MSFLLPRVQDNGIPLVQVTAMVEDVILPQIVAAVNHVAQRRVLVGKQAKERHDVIITIFNIKTLVDVRANADIKGIVRLHFVVKVYKKVPHPVVVR